MLFRNYVWFENPFWGRIKIEQSRKKGINYERARKEKVNLKDEGIIELKTNHQRKKRYANFGWFYKVYNRVIKKRKILILSSLKMLNNWAWIFISKLQSTQMAK